MSQAVHEFLTIKEAARYLGVSAGTLRNWDRAGKLKPMRHPKNGYRIYPQKELEQAVAQRGCGEERSLAEARVLATINRIGRTIAAELDLNRLVQVVTDEAREVIGAEFGAFFYNVLDEKGESYMLYTLSGAERKAFEGFAMPRNTAVFGPTFRGEGIVRSDDITADPRYGKNEPYFGMPGGHLPVRSYLAAPVVSRSGEVLGGLFFAHSQPGRFVEQHERILEGIAAQAAVGIDNGRLVERLRESERRFRLMANSIPQLAWMARPDGWIFWYNDQWYKYTGTTLDQMEGWGWQRVHDPEHLPGVMERWEHCIEAGEGFEMVFPLRGADGNYRIFLTRIEPQRDESGKITLWFGTNTDITEQRRHGEALRQSEERLRAVLETTPDCVKIVGPQGELVYMNPQGLKMIEAPGLGEVKGLCVFDVVAPEHREAWIANHRRVCQGEKVAWEFEIIGMGGTRRWMDTQAVPLPMSDGRLAHLAVTREITQRKQGEAERQQLLESERAARAEAERTSRMKDEFLATLSHELRTPLNAIVGWSTILRTPELSKEDLVEGLDTIERNARAQTQIIADLLDMSRIISGKVLLDAHRMELIGVVEAAMETLRPAAHARGIRLELAVKPGAFVVTGDASRLQQIFWNLLSNAIKFTPPGGQVRVLVERFGSWIEVSVIDTGEGIAGEFLAYVFDRFRQADASTTRRHGGLGLGLSIVKHLAELHGGSVRVASAGPGLGSTFTITLPAAGGKPQALPGERESDFEGNGCKPYQLDLDLSGVRIVVVEDEADSRALVERLLSDRKASVRAADSAVRALELVREQTPDVLVSDIGMPGQDGYWLIRQVRALEGETGRVPALALTAYARPEDRHRVLLSGYQMHVPKPVDPTELLAAVASLAGRIRPCSAAAG